MLTTTDLELTLADDDHLGWGWACAADISGTAKRERLTSNVVSVANELGLDYEDLFHWSNSKYGRWLTDEVMGRSGSVSRATVRKYLNAEAVSIANEGGALRREVA